MGGKTGITDGVMDKHPRKFERLAQDKYNGQPLFVTEKGYQWDYDGRAYFIYKNKGTGMWDVIHQDTGQRITFGSNRPSAVKYAVEELGKHSREEFDAKADASIAKHGRPPSVQRRIDVVELRVKY